MSSTFDNRASILTDQIPQGLRNEFAIANQKNWEAFLTKSNLHIDSLGDLKVVVNRIWNFLEYPLHEMLSGDQGQLKRWTKGNYWK